MRELRWPLLAAILIVSGAVSLLSWATQRPEGQLPPGFSAAETVELVMTHGPAELDIPPSIHVTSTRTFTLSRETRTNEEFGVELVQIHSDGTTEIRATETNRVLSAKPGECFSSDEFGRAGLSLDASFPVSGYARFTRTWCEAITKDAGALPE